MKKIKNDYDRKFKLEHLAVGAERKEGRRNTSGPVPCSAGRLQKGLNIS